MPEYDKWYKDVLNGKARCFYPKPIRLLENPGMIMFLFHVHHHALVGEAQIVRSTIENGRHLYWFDEFLSYPHFVGLELLQTDPKLARMAKMGRWRCVYVYRKTVEEVRSLSKLPVQERKKLGKKLKKVIEQMIRRPVYKPTPKFYVENECEKLRRRYKLDKQILAEAQKYFCTSVQKRFFIGRSLDEIFYTCLYLAFRLLGFPKLLSEVAKISGINPTKIGKLYRFLVRRLDLTVPPLNPEQLIKSRSDKLQISEKTIRKALSLVQEARDKKIIRGKAPSSIAAVAIFVACQTEGQKRSKKEIAEIFGISEPTLRNNLEILSSNDDFPAKQQL